jgi:hypothetical protein
MGSRIWWSLPYPNPAARLRRLLGLMGDQPQPLQSFAVFNKD